MISIISITALLLVSSSASFDPNLNHNFKTKDIKWTHLPTGGEIHGLYPLHALHNDIPGAALVNCHMLPDGALADCRVLEETPPGEGFGAATVRITEFFRAPAAAYGPEATVDIPMRWRTAPD